MNESLRVIGEYDPFERIFMCYKVGESIIGGCRHHDRPLVGTTLQSDDYIFLKYIVALESLAARLEQMHVLYGRSLQYKVAKRSIVRSIAEAPWDNRNQLPAVIEQ